MTDARLDIILDALDAARQRVTYGAAASLLSTAPRTLMSGRERDARCSWIVSRRSGQPTGYDAEQMHSDLLANEHIIETREELERWLESQGVSLAAAVAA